MVGAVTWSHGGLFLMISGSYFAPDYLESRAGEVFALNDRIHPQFRPNILASEALGSHDSDYGKCQIMSPSLVIVTTGASGKTLEHVVLLCMSLSVHHVKTRLLSLMYPRQ
jgi:hypothetical protein